MSILGHGDELPDLKFRAEPSPRSKSLCYRLIQARPLFREFSLQGGDLVALCVDSTSGLVLTFQTEGHSCPVIRSAQGSVPVEGDSGMKTRVGAQIHPVQNLGTAAFLDQPSCLNGSKDSEKFASGGTGEGCSR